MKLPVIQNAFENVKKFSQEKLVEKYPNGVPEAIQKRYLQELTFLESSDYIDDFEIFLNQALGLGHMAGIPVDYHRNSFIEKKERGLFLKTAPFHCPETANDSISDFVLRGLTIGHAFDKGD